MEISPFPSEPNIQLFVLQMLKASRFTRPIPVLDMPSILFPPAVALTLGVLLALTVSFAHARPGPANVVLKEITERTIAPTTRRTGVLRFDRITRLSPEVEGLIIHMRLDDGLKVKKGEAVARLSTDFSDRDRAVTEAEITEVQARIEQRATELKRLSTLRREAVASRSAYDEALYEHKALRAREEALRRQVARLRLRIERSVIRAPFDGVVLERLQEVGEWAAPGKALGRIAATDPVLAVFPVPESLLPFQNHPDDDLAIHIPALNKTLRGRRHGPVARTEVRTRSVYIEIRIPYEDGMLENLTVEADLPAGERRHLRMIPRDALLQQPGPATVYTVEDGKAKAVTFEIALRDGDEIGTDDPAITEHMKVVVDGNERLQDGQAVHTATAETQPATQGETE